MQIDLLLLIISSYILTITAQLNNILNYECETDYNCTNHLPNSICLERKCVCPFGYDLNGCKLEKTNGRKRRQISFGKKMLGEECDWSHQCRQTPVDGTKVCLARKCQCSHGYLSVDAYRCVKDFEPVLPAVHVTNTYENDPPGYGSACSTDRDCQQTGVHLECIRGTCVCFDGYVPLGKYICYNTRDEGAHILESSTIIPFQSSTTPISYPANNQVFRAIGKIGNTCTNDYFCRRAVYQSHCYNGKCTCMDGYIATDLYTCMKITNEEITKKSTLIPVDYKNLLGGLCSTKYNCHTSNAICLNSKCSCPKGYFPVDDWTCLEEPESSNEESIVTTSIIPTTTILSTTTTIFHWWPWSPTTTTHRTATELKNAFRVRCLINRQCASMDRNSHCTLFGRCICNPGYQLRTTRKGQRCVSQMINEDDCD